MRAPPPRRLLSLLPALAAAGAEPGTGGSGRVSGAASASFARLVNDSSGVWWVSRGGAETVSLGITAMEYANFVDQKTGVSRYKVANDKRFGGNHSAWADASVALLQQLGFNTVGPWSDPAANEAAGRAGALYTPIVGLSALSGAYSAPRRFPDVFSPDFAANASLMARRAVPSPCEDGLRDDPALLGWYSDNELPWYLEAKNCDGLGIPSLQEAGYQRTTSTNLLWQFLCLPAASPGRAVATDYLRAQLRRQSQQGSRPAAELLSALPELLLGGAADPGVATAAAAAALRDAAAEHEGPFAYNASRAYFSTVASVIRECDPNHLVLGPKFTGIDALGGQARFSDTFDDILRGAAGFIDAHSIDVYSYGPGREMLEHYYDVSGVPWILAESMGFRGTINLSEDPNLLGAGPVVPDQAARARAWGVFARKTLAAPFVVGLNHFTWCDEPPGGRPGGESGNYGVVSVDGAAYEELHHEMAAVLSAASALHSAGAARCPLDTARFGAAPGRLQQQVDGAAQCLAALPTGAVAAAPCAAGAAAQQWEVVDVGGAVGRRLRNVGSGGCLHIFLGTSGENSRALRGDGNCSTPTDWQWPPAWRHDDDCSVMQYCGYPVNATRHGATPGWAANVCTYDQSCVSLGDGGAAAVAACTGAAPQRFAFVAAQ